MKEKRDSPIIYDMKWSFVIQQKFKAAMLLGGVMVLIILSNLLSRNHVEGMNKSFSSIYKDRLIPATTITYLAEHLYGKRLSLEKFMLSNDSGSVVSMRELLRNHNAQIDSLVKSFEGTYLVENEVQSLSSFKNRVAEYALLETMVLNMYASGNQGEGRNLFEGTGTDSFQNTIVRLNELTTIQSDIGKQLMKESKSEMAGFSTISLLQISLAVVIGLMIIALIQNAKIINIPKKTKEGPGHFHLN